MLWEVEVLNESYEVDKDTRMKALVEGARLYIEKHKLNLPPTRLIGLCKVKRIKKEDNLIQVIKEAAK